MVEWQKLLADQTQSPDVKAAASNLGPAIEIVNVMQPGYGNVGIISFYAAGIGVMFLLFSCSGAAGTLLDELETGTLGRLIGSRAGMSGVPHGKWLFLTLWGSASAHRDVYVGALVFTCPRVSSPVSLY
jgi:hypothetical protein